MKVVYILNGTALYGGVKVVFQQARAMRRLGVDAQVVSPEPPGAWFPGLDEIYRQVGSLEPDEIGPADLAIGTIWFTVPKAMAVPGAVPCHLCQCYEALYDGIRPQWPEIDAVYRLPTAKLAISPHLVDLLEERFGQRAHWIPQPFEPHRFLPPSDADAPPDRPFRVLLAGQWDLPIKGVQWGMEALRPLFDDPRRWQLVRLAIDAPAEELALWPDAERHVAISPDEVPAVLASVDAYVGLSTEVEGFGLPALEAMSCARPAVLTDIGATRALDPGDRASIKIPVGDGEALRLALRRLHADAGLRQELGRGGRQIAESYTEERTAQALVEVFEGLLRSA